MKHCSTERYFPDFPGFTTPKARKQVAQIFRDDAFQRHLQRLPEWIVWGGEFRTEHSYHAGPGLVVVTRCKNGHLTTVVHGANETYPSP